MHMLPATRLALVYMKYGNTIYDIIVVERVPYLVATPMGWLCLSVV